MSLNRIKQLTLGVPDLDVASEFYEDFGLRPEYQPGAESREFSTVDEGSQLRLVRRPVRRLLDAVFAADSPDDCHSIASRFQRLSISHVVTGTGHATALSARDMATGLVVQVVVDAPLRPKPHPAPVYNGPGRFDRLNARADGVGRTGRVRPRRLGHFVLGTTDYPRTLRFFVEGLGFRTSDLVKDSGAFLRCTTDHHNVLIQRAPVPFMHHTSWQVEDVDEIGRGAMHMLEGDPERHVWGLGRHYAGSNFFWYLKDPAGNFAEYHSDMDCIPEDAIWTPEVLEGARGLFQWGPPPPPSFLAPEDLADLMIAGHS